MKISALTAATTPLSGAELFPIVQSGNTRRVSLNDLLRSIGNGTAAAPALAPGGDPNTGIYFPAADTIGFVEGGVEVWRMSSSGHFLAGTDTTFDIGASGANRPRDLFLGRNATVAGNLTVDTNTLFVDATNNRVGVGVTSTIAQLCNTATSDSITGVQPTGFVWRSTDNDWAAAIISRPASGLSYGLRVHSGGATASDYPLWVSSGAGTGTGLLQLNGAGNLGLGVTPSAWTGSVRAIQVGNNVTLSGLGVSRNAVYDTAWKYIGNDAATSYQQGVGVHAWYTAPSGTAGNAITFTQAMTLDASGKLQIGATGPATFDRVIISGTDATANDLTLHGAATSQVRINFSRPSGLGQGEIGYNMSTDVMRFVTAAVDRWRINASGHFLASADATYDIGASGATRPRDLFLGRNMVGAGWVRAGAASAGAASTTTIGGTTATTVGAAGAASALPANPLGYIVAHVGTTEVRIPYYNA